ncbi:carbohydrate-binding module family 50 protein [Peniophora sp. CONT]|nr:carbohydrate-binding module family 50 protein [Peniophora sp. CONT]
MGRWTQMDEDEYRLPAGMKRVGYDADTGRYYFSGGGALWEGAQGAEFSEMRKVESAPIALPEGDDDDVEAGPTTADGYAPLSSDGPRVRFAATDNSYKMMFPFFLIIIVFLLLVFRLVHPSQSTPPRNPCTNGTVPTTIVSGDTCWNIAKAHGCSLDDLATLNPGVQCEKLQLGSSLCVPPKPL